MEDQDQIKTALFKRMEWLAPVERSDLLPIKGVAEGAHCFVEGPDGNEDAEVWVFRNGSWFHMIEL